MNRKIELFILISLLCFSFLILIFISMFSLYSDNFYVFLSSNVELTSPLQVGNSIGRYYTQLPEKLNLTEDYEVALTEITYTKSWFNIQEDQKILLLDQKLMEHDNDIYLRAGSYTSVNDIIKDINAELLKFGSAKSLSQYHTPVMFYDNENNKVTIKGGMLQSHLGNESRVIGAIPIFPRKLSLILGLYDASGQLLRFENVENFAIFFETWRGITVGLLFQAYHQVDLNVIKSLLVYSDIIKPSLVGNMREYLLRPVEIPIDCKFGDHCVLKYKNPYYHPLNHLEIENILIDIRDDKGNEVSFTTGKSTATLHFRRRKDGLESFYKLLR